MDATFQSIASEAMLSVWSRAPRSYQNKVIPHLLKMMAGHIVCAPTLLVQSTGSGKSSVPLTAAVVDGGVTIILENTLALGSNQRFKVLKDSNLSTKYVKGFQLDLFRSKEDKASLSAASMSHLSSNISTSLITRIYFKVLII